MIRDQVRRLSARNLAPMITPFMATLASGFTFAGIVTVTNTHHALWQFMKFVAFFVPIVVLPGVFNAVIIQILIIHLKMWEKREWNDQGP